jgi:DNA-binding NtrC family response regulator
MGNVCTEAGKPLLVITEDALEALKEMPWTGNVRELRNVIERLAILCDKEVSAEDVRVFAQPMI